MLPSIRKTGSLDGARDLVEDFLPVALKNKAFFHLG
jgi:hypothetical protein